MKKIKLCLSLLCAFALVFQFSMITSSANEFELEKINNEVSEEFRSITDKIFSGDETYDVLNNEEESVLKDFIEENREYYQTSAYDSIRQNFIDNKLRYRTYILEKEISTYASDTYVVNASDQFEFSQSGFNVSYRVLLRGVVRVNGTTGVVTSYDNPSVSLTYCSITGGRLTNVSTGAEWASSTHRSVIFKGEFRLEVAFVYGFVPFVLNDPTTRGLTAKY